MKFSFLFQFTVVTPLLVPQFVLANFHQMHKLVQVTVPAQAQTLALVLQVGQVPCVQRLFVTELVHFHLPFVHPRVLVLHQTLATVTQV